jgi:hypothetical protein
MARARLTRWLDTQSATSHLTDDTIIPEGARWPSQAVVFTSPAGSLTYDLGEEHPVGGIYFQGDAAAAFSLLLSPDGKSWRKLTLDAVPGTPGVRSRTAHIDRMPVRFVRIGEPTGHPDAIATELQLFCELPASLDLRTLARDPAPVAMLPPLRSTERVWLALTGVPWLTLGQATVLKLLLALSGVALLLFGARIARRPRNVLLVALGVAGYSGYYDWGAYRFPNYAHGHELFHYFVGAKYFRELGYLHLYDCANVADAEDGFRRRLDTRKIRDLSTNGVIDARIALDRADECKRAFSDERWAAFKDDVAFFRDHADPASWDTILRDHGFNPSPAWTMTGGLLANQRPASRSFVGYADAMTTGLLALLDPALVVVMFAAIAWAFGWEAACVAAIFFGCNPLASFLWTGGSYLRQDWLAATVAGICALKKTRSALGGGGLAYAMLLRVFPGGLLLPVALRMAWIGWRERRLDRPAARILAGAALCTIVVAVASGIATGGMHSWRDFGRNTAKLTSTPSENLVGLRTILSLRPSTRTALLYDDSLPDPSAPLREARKENFAQARPIYFLCVVVLLAGLLRAVRRAREPWVLACVGAAAVPILTEMSCYYTSLLLVTALLLRERRHVAVGLLLACAALLVLHLTLEGDVLYACASLVLVAFAGWMIWVCGNAPAEEPAPAVDDAPGRAGGARLWLAWGAAVSIALLASCRLADPLMTKDQACEERWTELAGALRSRAALAPLSLEARRRATTLPMVGEDFADSMKVSAFARAQADLRDPLGALVGAQLAERIVRARDRYDDSVTDLDTALEAAPGAINRADGRPLRARVHLSPAPL